MSSHFAFSSPAMGYATTSFHSLSFLSSSLRLSVPTHSITFFFLTLKHLQVLIPLEVPTTFPSLPPQILPPPLLRPPHPKKPLLAH